MRLEGSTGKASALNNLSDEVDSTESSVFSGLITQSRMSLMTPVHDDLVLSSLSFGRAR